MREAVCAGCAPATTSRCNLFVAQLERALAPGGTTDFLQGMDVNDLSLVQTLLDERCRTMTEGFGNRLKQAGSVLRAALSGGPTEYDDQIFVLNDLQAEVERALGRATAN